MTTFLPIFEHDIGCTVRWLEFKVVAIVLHRGQVPSSGHYQGILHTGGGRFLTDDNRVAVASPHLPEMEPDVYLFWLVAKQALTPAFGKLIEPSNPPFCSHTLSWPSMPPGQLRTKQPIVRSIASPTRAESTQPAENNIN